MIFEKHKAPSSGIWNFVLVSLKPVSIVANSHQGEDRFVAKGPLLAFSPLFCHWARAVHRYISVCLLTLFFCLFSAHAPCQILSRPSTVQLIARVESVGVSIASNNDTNLSAISDGNARQHLDIKTSWAVPPNFTRLNLIGSLSSGCKEPYARGAGVGPTQSEQTVAGPIALNGNNGPGPDRGGLPRGIASNPCGELWTQSSGSTNLANARVDQIGFAGRGDEDRSEESRDSRPLLTLTLEAF